MNYHHSYIFSEQKFNLQTLNTFMKPYKILNSQIVDTEKGILNNSFASFIGPADSLFPLFIRSLGYRQRTDTNMIFYDRYQFTVYDKNPLHIEMFKHMLEWDGNSGEFDRFQSFDDHITKGKEKLKLKGTSFPRNSTLGKVQRHGFIDFKEAWNTFRKSKFTFIEIDAIHDNQRFCEYLYHLEAVDINTRQFVKLDFNKTEYDPVIYTEAINNILHVLWMKSFKEYQSVVELIDDNNVPYEDFAGKLYAKLNPTFCVLPWMHIQYKPTGQAKPCCRYDNIKENKDYDASLENSNHVVNLSELFQERAKELVIQNASMEDAFYSNYWNTARNLTVENKPISGCHKCYKEEQVSGEVATSMRLGSSVLYNEGYLHKKPKFEQPIIEFLEVGFGNYCNLACLTCNSTLSTTWHDDEVKLNEIADKPLQRMIFPKLDNLKFEPNEQTLKTLRLIKFTGGEPMINPEFIKFIDLICEKGFPGNISLEIYTNCSYIPSPKLLENLKKFKSIQLNLSIDAHGPTNDYIRYGSKWFGEGKQTVSNALEFWLEQGLENQNIYVIMATTMSVLNIFDVPKLVSWWMDKYKDSGNKIAPRTSSLPSEVEGFYKLQLAFEPSYISIDILPREYYAEIEQWVVDYEANFINNYPDLGFIPQSINATLNKLKNAVERSKGNTTNAKLFLNYLEKMDNIRGNSAEESIPHVVGKVKEFLAKNAG